MYKVIIDKGNSGIMKMDAKEYPVFKDGWMYLAATKSYTFAVNLDKILAYSIREVSEKPRKEVKHE